MKKHAENEKNNKAKVDIKKKQPMCAENGASVKINSSEAIEKLKAEHEAIVGDLKIKHEAIVGDLKMKHEAIVGDLQMGYEAEVRNLHMYYESRICELHMNHEMVFSTLQRNHETLVNHLRYLNYSQGIRQEAALRSMRELKDKMHQDHQKEVQDMHLKYDNMLKEHRTEIESLIEEKELLYTDYERVLGNFRETTQVLKMDIKTTMKSFRTEHETVIKLLRNEYKSPLEISSSNLTKQYGTEVEGLQRKLADEKQQPTILAATTNGHEDNNADTTTSTIADNDAIVMVKSQDTMPQKTEEDFVQIFYDTVQKLSLLHEYVYSKESNCSTKADDLQQQLYDFKVDAHDPQNNHDNKDID